MIWNIKPGQHFWRNMLTRALLIIGCITLIIWSLPRNDAQNFHYDVGKPWMYGSFIAKFDFPVYKTDEVLQHERDSVMKEFQPYYTLKSDVEHNCIAKLQADYKEGFPGLPFEYVQIITNRLHRIYQAGVLSTPEYNSMAVDSTTMLRIVTGKEATSQSISFVYSTRTAYEKLFIDEELGEMRQALQKCNLDDYIEPNLIYDKQRTESERNDLINSIPVSKGMVVSGQKIVDRGDIINEYTARVLASFEKEVTKRTASSSEIKHTLFGQIIYVSIIVFLFSIYIYLFRKDFLEKPRSLLLLYVLITVYPILVSLVMKHSFFSVYLIPFCIAPVFVRVFLDSRTAFTTHVTMIMICSVSLTYQYEFMAIQLVAGLVTVYSLREMSKRSQVLQTALYVVISSSLVYYALQLMQGGNQQKLDTDMYYHFVVNGILILLAYPLMYIVEKMFDFSSDVTLFELSNTNHGLLRQLSEIAPGTFQHSITVANIAASIANKIGADSLLVRTGALYHDIGKMDNPVFFTENQVGVNPHDNMTNMQSAQIIIGHVMKGISFAEKHNLPQFVKEFILTHHGKGIAKYFYINEKNEHPDEEIDPTPFSYLGPNPFTREQAILMMADAVEAASRSLTEYTEETITNLVNKLIDSQVADGFFTECPITFRDIATAKQVLIERLKNIYHTRISYPDEKNQEQKK